MQPKHAILFQPNQEELSTSQHFAQTLDSFLAPLVLVLDQVLDQVLVRTLVQGCVATLRFRKSKQALLLSESGSSMTGYVGLSPTATAGTKRLGKLLRSLKGSAAHLDGFLLEEAGKEVERLKAQGKRILSLFDGSVLEKPESRHLQATAPVLSSKAKRLNRSRLGLLFNLPSLRPIRVMGREWTGAIITGLEGIPRLAVMRWWTTKGDYAAKMREIEQEVLRVLVRRWGALLTFVFDRGYASGPWLEVLERFGVRFVLRWIKKHVFVDREGREKKLGEIGRGKRYLAHQLIHESSSGLKLTCELWWTPLRHPTYPHHLYLVKARVKGHVCSLMTNERVQTEAQAWEIFFAYKRRWQIDTSFRYGKCELALESPRLWSLDSRLKLLGIVLLRC